MLHMYVVLIPESMSELHWISQTTKQEYNTVIQIQRVLRTQSFVEFQFVIC